MLRAYSPGSKWSTIRFADARALPRACVLRSCYTLGMSTTTTIRLSDEDRQLLAALVSEFGDQSTVIRQGIRLLALERRRRETLNEVLAAWEAEAGPLDEDEVDSMQRRYFDR